MGEESGYWDTVESIAETIKEECKTMEDAYDRLHEEVDGNYYIIYTAANYEVMMNTHNDDAYFDQFGSHIESDSFSRLLSQVAYCAMYQDVVDELDGWDPSVEKQVVVETMPKWLRASHVAAGRGFWPHDGAVRFATDESTAQAFIEGDEEWSAILEGEDPSDYEYREFPEPE